MKRILVTAVALACLALAGTGCRSDAGSREFRPGQGWRPV